MIQNVIRTLGGIDRYGIASLCLFAGVFVGVLLWALLLKRPHLEQMARLPLEPENPLSPNQEPDHE